MVKALDTLKDAFLKTLEPPPELNIWEWADEYRVLSSEASSEPGPWRSDRFPYLKEIMEELSPQNPRDEVVLMSGAQVGKTECCLNMMGYTIHYDPTPMLYIQKTVDAVMKFSSQRFTKSLENTPEIRERLPAVKSREDANTKLLKNFAGGILIMGGANSAASLRSMPIGKLMLDEEDSYEMDIQEEGDPTELAIRRTANFPRRKIFHLSTPKIKETSRIEPAFYEGDQRYYYVPCPHCDNYDTIRWENIKYTDDDPNTAELLCTACGSLIQERYKTQMLSAGKWKATEPGREIASFHLNSLYSPLGFYSWKDAVKLWLKYKRTHNTEILRVFVNTVLGETYSESGKSVEFSILEKRKEDYPADVPNNALILTAGVDIQEDRIEAEIVGWGAGQESWSIDYTRIMGDTEYDFVWNQLDDYLKRTWIHESGLEMLPALTAIDSGHRARTVYQFCKRNEHRRIFPVKGQDGWGRGLINRPAKRNKDLVYLFNVFVDEMKSKIYSQLKVDVPGPGYCHFPRKDFYDMNYFRQLTSEKLVNKRIAGRNKLKWELPAGRRNEALDCRAYAIAALNILNPNFEALRDRGGPMSGTQTKIRKKRRLLSKGI